MPGYRWTVRKPGLMTGPAFPVCLIRQSGHLPPVRRLGSSAGSGSRSQKRTAGNLMPWSISRSPSAPPGFCLSWLVPAGRGNDSYARLQLDRDEVIGPSVSLPESKETIRAMEFLTVDAPQDCIHLLASMEKDQSEDLADAQGAARIVEWRVQRGHPGSQHRYPGERVPLPVCPFAGISCRGMSGPAVQ